MRQGQVRVVAPPERYVHARSVNERGQIVPRCGARKTSKSVAEMIVTANVARVSCERCREALS